MVAVVGGKAERKLGHIARAEHERAARISEIHEDLSTLTGLRVLINDVMYALVVSYILELLRYGVLDIYLGKVGAERRREKLGV